LAKNFSLEIQETPICRTEMITGKEGMRHAGEEDTKANFPQLAVNFSSQTRA
jgi:hypothetical protein